MGKQIERIRYTKNNKQIQIITDTDWSEIKVNIFDYKTCYRIVSLSLDKEEFMKFCKEFIEQGI
jgi:hypothetical protein